MMINQNNTMKKVKRPVIHLSEYINCYRQFKVIFR